MYRETLIYLAAVTLPASLAAQSATIDREVERYAADIIELRHQIHQNPELGNREFETARLVADHLRALGMEVQTGIAHTGVVALLRGGRPGPVVAVRADIRRAWQAISLFGRAHALSFQELGVQPHPLRARNRRRFSW